VAAKHKRHIKMKTGRPMAWTAADCDQFTVGWRLLSRRLCQISAYFLYCLKL